jgi:glycosyltransferase involved in cell wall biosynthesis
MKISIVIPAYNEKERIFNTISETSRVMKELHLDHEIIVVDDGSKDGTHDEMLRASLVFGNVRPVRYEKNQGKGHAIKHAFEYVTGDVVTFLDADLDLHPSQIPTFIEYMEKYHADVVVGSKRHPKSQLDYPAHRRILSFAYNILTRILFDLSLTDTQAGLKLFKCEVLKKVFPRVLVKQYAFDLEVLVNAHHLGYKIVEAPIIVNFQRKLGRIRIKDIKTIAIDTAAIFYRLRILKYYDRVDPDGE